MNNAKKMFVCNTSTGEQTFEIPVNRQEATALHALLKGAFGNVQAVAEWHGNRGTRIGIDEP